MRYFKIYNRNVTKSQPLKELSEDQFLADLVDYILDTTSFNEDGCNYDKAISDLFEICKDHALSKNGLCTGDYYLYIADDSKTVLDFNRKNA